MTNYGDYTAFTAARGGLEFLLPARASHVAASGLSTAQHMAVSRIRTTSWPHWPASFDIRTDIRNDIRNDIRSILKMPRQAGVQGFWRGDE